MSFLAITTATAKPPQDTCTAPATAPQPTANCLPSTVCAAATGTPQEESLAKQKAAFVMEAWQLSRSRGIAVKDACALVATRTDHFPGLVTSGKKGASLIAGNRAWSNYRSWSTKLGKLDGSRQPDCDNWRSLLPQYRGSRDYLRPGPDEFWNVLANLYEHPNQLSLRYSYKLARMACREQGIGDVPSYGAARYNYEHHADKKAIYIARHGEDAFRNNVAGYISREAPEVDEAWSGDHHVFDAAVRVWDETNGRWVPTRPWLTAWVDWGSLYFIGIQIRALDPNRDAIERALRDGLTKNGFHPPACLYIDNGKDYKARGFSQPIAPLTDSDCERVSSVCEALGCQVHFAIPYNARAKIAERMFRIVCEQFSKLWTSYRGSNPQKRPATADAAWKDPENLPTLDQFTVSFERWLAKIYHDSASTGKALHGQTPNQARSLSHPMRPALQPIAIYKAFLRELPGGPRKIHRGGVIRWTVAGQLHEYRSEALWKLMGNTEQVRVKVDPDDISTVWIYTVDGREIGPASSKSILPAFTHGDETNIEQLRIEQKRHARQTKEVKQLSAARRAMPRWLNAPGAPGAAFLPPVGSAVNRSVNSAAVHKSVAQSAPSDPDLQAELEATLREQTLDRLASLDSDHQSASDDDFALLDAINHEEPAEHVPF